MQASTSQSMQRSISMPTKPAVLETKSLKRSEEKETVYEEDYYPESPAFERCKRLSKAIDNNATSLTASKSENDITLAHNWTGSTIELRSDYQQNDFDQTLPLTQRKRPQRLVERNGHENISFRRIPEKSWRYICDLVTTLIELDWKYMLTMFFASYFFSWFFFAVLCYIVSYTKDDLEFANATSVYLPDGKVPCIRGVYNFPSMLIYSIETQTTIGFGEKYPNEECPEIVFLFILQIVCSIAIEGGMISIIYVKTARPAKQITKLKFSDKAVICYRDGKLCLLFRVCDPRKQQTIQTKIRLYLIMDKLTQEGEMIKIHKEMKLDCNGQQLIEWPEIVCHVIDDLSPLCRFTSARQFNAAQFELLVSIVGISAATAQITEARTSYLPKEIFWGQRFVNIITYDVIKEQYVVDYSNFNTTISVDMNTDKNEVAQK